MTDRSSAPPDDPRPEVGDDQRRDDAEDALRQIAEAEATLAELRARLAAYASATHDGEVDDEDLDDEDHHLYGQDPTTSRLSCGSSPRI